LAVLGALLAGCGGGDSGGGQPDRPQARSPAAGAAAGQADADGAAQPARALPAAARPLLDDDLRAAAEGAGASAAVGLISVDGKTAWSATAGAARDQDAVFAVASVTKTFVAVLTLRLAEQGRLRLDDEVGRWLGDAVGEDVRPVTIRQLLGHTSDLTDEIPTRRLRAALRDPRHRWTERELLRAMARAPEPQGAFTYANANYILLGAILRRASGLGTEALLRREIVAPLGLRRTSFRPRPALAAAMPGGRVPTYAWGELFTDGGMVSTAPDLARLLHALVVERRMLQPESLRQMLAPGPDGRYGLGIINVSPTSTCELYGHGGFWPGGGSVAVADPRSGVATVVLLRDATGDDAASGAKLLLNSLRNQGVVTCR